MGRKDDVTIDEVAQRIAEVNEQYHRREVFEVILLVTLFAGGMGLLIAGAVVERWELLVPGGIIQCMTVWPLRQIARLREDKMRLQVVLQLLKLSTNREAKVLAAELVRRLIQQV